jgi:hypothetical protein
LGGQANAITIAWTLVIGVSAILASYFLLNKKTKKWSDNRIFFTSVAGGVLVASVAIVLS